MPSYSLSKNSIINKMSYFSRRILAVLGLTFACLTKVLGQSEVDISQLVADTKSFSFDDKKTTVKGYIYNDLEKKTDCCGSDRIYLEVRIHPSGYVIDAKTLTGKNDCFKNSAIDIVKNIKWDAQDFKGTKPVYFEIRPDINCESGNTNEYAQVPIVNNELLDENGDPKDPDAGNTIYLGDTQTQEQEEALAESGDEAGTEEAETIETTMTDTQEETTSTEQEPEEETGEMAVSESEETQQESGADMLASSETEEPAQKSSSEEREEQTTELQSQPILVSANESNDGPARDMAEETQEIGEREAVAQVDTPPATTAQSEESAEEEARKEAEIEQLQTQLDELRAKEEALQEREKQRQEYQRRRRDALEERRRQMQQQQNTEGDPFSDGETPSTNEEQEGEVADGRDDQDRDQEDLDRLSQELSEIESRKRELQESRRRDAEEIRQYIQERIRIEEEVRRKEEEINRKREQQELDRIREDMRVLEEDKRELESEMQRLMDEIQRLQDEMNQKVAELERQEVEIQRLNINFAQRENEINRERVLREQQLEQELALMEQQAELEIMGLTGANVPSTTSPTTPSIRIDPRLLQDTSAQAREYVNKIMQLQEQMNFYQNQLQTIQGQGTRPGQQGYSTTTPGGVSGTTGAPDDVKRADQDQSWQDIDYNSPQGQSAQTQGNIGTRRPTGQAGTGYDSVYGYSPDTSHASTYKNVAGPRFRNMQYGTGTEAMNRFLSDQLRSNGICGPVKAFAELTVNGQGQVIDVRPIKANTTQILINLPAVLNGLTFMPTYSDIPARINLEFETTIRCGGGPNLPANGQYNPGMSNPASN